MAGVFVCHEEQVRLQLCAHAAQAMLDDHNPATHGADYLVKGGIVPRFAGDGGNGGGNDVFSTQHAVHYGRTAQEEIAKHHHALQGVPPFNAMFQFLLLACQQDSYGADRFEGSRKGKAVLVGVNCHGVRIYPRDHWGDTNHRLASYVWPEIGHISYRGKVFTVVKRSTQRRGGNPKDNIKTNGKLICQSMWSSAVRRHTFHRRRRVPMDGAGSPFRRAIGFSAESPMKHSRMSGRTELEVMRAASIQGRANMARSPYGRATPATNMGSMPRTSPPQTTPPTGAAPPMRRERVSVPTLEQSVLNEAEMAAPASTSGPVLDNSGSLSYSLTTTFGAPAGTVISVQEEDEDEVLPLPPQSRTKPKSGGGNTDVHDYKILTSRPFFSKWRKIWI